MTRVFDNIQQDLLTTLRGTMQVADAFQLSPVEADYIAGYDIKYRIGHGSNND